MNKKIISLLAILFLSGCSGNNQVSTSNPKEEPTSTSTPTEVVEEEEEVVPPYEYPDGWTYKEVNEEPIVVTKDTVEVSSIEVRGIPKTGIKVACFDEYEIYLDILYSDASTESIRLLEKYIPVEYRHYLGEVGHHSISIAINASVVSFSFDVVKNPDFYGYKCTFVDNRDKQVVLEEKMVGYYENVSFTGVTPEPRKIDSDNVQRFIGWDLPLENIHQDMYYIAQYRDVQKRYYTDQIEHMNEMCIASSKKDETYRTLSYLGRVHSVAISYGETIHHDKGNEEEALSFSSLNPYGVKWNKMNEMIFENSIDYVYNANYGSYLYGTTGAFSTAPTFLNIFESYFNVTSHDIIVITGEKESAEIHTSVEPSFGTCYNLAEAHQSETKSINKNAESGYYRIALTVSFDVYLSTSFEKVVDNRYSLLKGSKFLFSPVIDSEVVRTEFSETTEFDKTIEKPLAFSTEDLYNVANGLDW